MRVIIILAATYPSGTTGSVVLIWKVDETERERVGLGELCAEVEAYYHKQIGPAYAIDDFVYTVWFVEDEPGARVGSEFFYLCGPHMLEHPTAPDAVRP